MLKFSTRSEIEKHWFPLEFNAFEVIRREEGFAPGNDAPCFGAGFLEPYYRYTSDGPLSLSTVCDLTQDHEINSVCRQHLKCVKEETRKTLIYWRSEDPKSGNVPKHFVPNCPTVYIVEGFRQLIQKETFNIDENDAIDFLHATVPIAYSDFVLLDRHWADLAGKLKLPFDCVKVYSPKDVEKFLEDLEQFQESILTVK